jgi:hypothetical protein
LPGGLRSHGVRRAAVGESIVSQKRIDRLAKNFRVLSDWTITFDADSDLHAQCYVGSKKRVAVIYSWGELGPEAKDYLLHEILHVAYQAAARRGREGEELLVQDLCRFIEARSRVG